MVHARLIVWTTFRNGVSDIFATYLGGPSGCSERIPAQGTEIISAAFSRGRKNLIRGKSHRWPSQPPYFFRLPIKNPATGFSSPRGLRPESENQITPAV
jgi:hypothetical protein